MFAGMFNLIDNLAAQDEHLVGPLNVKTPLYHSWWSILSLMLSFVPLGVLPHLGNKLWALKGTAHQSRFLALTVTFIIILAMLTVGGLLARALLGDALFAQGANPNQALPMLFIELFPTWLAALVGVGVLAAIMSTADGLVVSSSQIIANDLYRRSIVPRLKQPPTEAQLDRQVLYISRVSTIVILVVCATIAWAWVETNVMLIIWIGTGGIMSAFFGSLVFGAFWRGVTRAGAYAGLMSGFLSFLVLHTQLLDPAWFAPGSLHAVISWLYIEGTNPFSCSSLAGLTSVAFTIIVSKVTQPLPEAHVTALFEGA